MNKSKNTYTLSILAAGCLWGFMGLFRRYMGEAGFSSSGVIVLRCGVAALCFALTLLLTGASQFRVRLRDAWCFFGSGVVSLLFFTFCYFQAMNYMSLSAAAILLYTAPAIVTLLSALLFKERLTGLKLLAVLLAFLGCALVSGLGAGDMALSTAGILYGLGAGFGYAMYSIFARYALERGYSSNTINFYSCLPPWARRSSGAWTASSRRRRPPAGTWPSPSARASSPATCPICSIPTASRAWRRAAPPSWPPSSLSWPPSSAQPCSTSVWAFCHTAASCSCSQP